MVTFLDVRNEVFDLHYTEEFSFFVRVGAERDRWLRTLDAVGDDLRAFLQERAGDAGEPFVFDPYAEVSEDDRAAFHATYERRDAA